MIKKILLTIISISSLVFISLVVFLSFGVKEAKTGTEHNVTGWAWSDNIGWISFNCTDPNTCGTVNYGVNIQTDGIFEGYAWSENIGWIDFAPSGGYPEDPQYSARVNIQNGEVSGWARALAYGDGWDGWIKLRGTAQDGSSYGVSISTSTGEFSGYAWGSEVVGWIKFNCSTSPDECSTSSYKVITSFGVNQRPYVEPNSAKISGENYCNIEPGVGQISFEWTYQDKDGDSQSRYHLQVATDPGFNNLVIDREIPLSVSPGAKGTSAVLVVPDPTTHSRCISDGDFEGRCVAYGNSYYWRIRVKAAVGNQDWSDWETGSSSFTTPSHAYPFIDFSWQPAKPKVNEQVQFTDKSIVYGGANKQSLYWTFQDGDPVTSTQSDPTVKFISKGPKEITLKVTDSDGFVCTGSKTLEKVTLPPPEWKEVSPF